VLPAGQVDVAAIEDNLRQRTARGVLVSMSGQIGTFVLRTVSMVVMARLVTPEQFGLVGMVTAVTGVLALFRDGGLSQATVQRAVHSEQLTSTLFWINLGLGAALFVITAILAPAIAAFFSEPRLTLITVAIGSGFLFGGASAQHRAVLLRQMKFDVLVKIDLASLAASIVVGIGVAISGGGYWALVAMAVSQPALNMVMAWLASGWKPRAPKREAGIGSMIRYGGLLTLNGLVVYVAYNLDKVLLGRFWGAQVLGVYGRAYQLVSIPTENLQSAVGSVMFPALSRLQSDPVRMRSYFLKGYGLFLSLVMPITASCALFAEDIVRVLLGSQWHDSVPVFRYLAPTILAFALINPFGHLMQASGRVLRSLLVALLIAPTVVVAYLIGLPNGAEGVAMGYALAMALLVIPVSYLARMDTLITMSDLFRTALMPFVSTAAGSIAAVAISRRFENLEPFFRLTIACSVLLAVHAAIVLMSPQHRSDVAMILRSSRRSPQLDNHL